MCVFSNESHSNKVECCFSQCLNNINGYCQSKLDNISPNALFCRKFITASNQLILEY